MLARGKRRGGGRDLLNKAPTYGKKGRHEKAPTTSHAQRKTTTKQRGEEHWLLAGEGKRKTQKRSKDRGRGGGGKSVPAGRRGGKFPLFFGENQDHRGGDKETPINLKKRTFPPEAQKFTSLNQARKRA